MIGNIPHKIGKFGLAFLFLNGQWRRSTKTPEEVELCIRHNVDTCSAGIAREKKHIREDRYRELERARLKKLSLQFSTVSGESMKFNQGD
jgi:hypothetical protein